MQGRYAPIGSRLGMACQVGWEVGRNGNKKAKLEYREYVQTAEGRIEIHEWLEKALEEVKELGMESLFGMIKEYCKKLKWLHTDEELYEHALNCFYGDAYLYWEDFTIIWG